MFCAHRVYIRQVRAVGLYLFQPPSLRRENPGHISPVLQDPEYLSFTTAQAATFLLAISYSRISLTRRIPHTSYTGPKSEQYALVFTMQCNSPTQGHGTQFYIPSSPLSDGYSVQLPTNCTANTALFMYFIWPNVIIRFMCSKYSA